MLAKSCDLKLNEPVTSAAVPRWKRKEQEGKSKHRISSKPPSNNASFSSQSNVSSTFGESLNSSTVDTQRTDVPVRKAPSLSLKMPYKTTNSDGTPKKKNTPKMQIKSVGTPKKVKTPGKKLGHQTPKEDRFIAPRGSNNFDASGFHILNNHDDSKDSPLTRKYKEGMKQNLNITSEKILNMRTKAPVNQANALNAHSKVLFSQSTGMVNPQAASRCIPQTEWRVLDAPGVNNDFYINLLDWSPRNILCVALGDAAYLWDASSGEISELCSLGETQITSVQWSPVSPQFLAIGTADNTVQLWNVEKQALVRTMAGHTDRVGSLSWSDFILSSGSRSGAIFHHDVRVAQHHIATLVGHDQEVCGLAYSPDKSMLASGSNDNTVRVWQGTDTVPLHTLIEHTSAVKALAWCPTSQKLLATGGGTADRQICFWNAGYGSLQNKIDTGSQVSSLVWSLNTKEIVSGHGYSQNQLTVWKYPSMTRIAELTGHADRVLQLAMSPDGSTVMSLGADESLRLWKIFDVDPAKKEERSKKSDSRSKLSMRLR